MKHKIKIISLLIFLFGFICFAFYDSNLKGKDEVVLVNEIFSTKKVGNTEKEKKDNSKNIEKKEDFIKEDVEEEVIETSFTQETIEEETIEEEKTENVQEITEEEVVPVTYTNYDLGHQIVNYALNYVGYPYVYGGNSLTGGTDCSGFTKLVYGHFGIELPRVARDQQYAGYHVSLSELAPGDIVLSGYNGQIGHASIYIGNNQLVHALNERTGIVVTNLYIMPILEVRRVI